MDVLGARLERQCFLCKTISRTCMHVNMGFRPAYPGSGTGNGNLKHKKLLDISHIETVNYGDPENA